MSDLPDFYQGTSPGFGMARTGQVLTRVYYDADIATGVTQVNTTVVNLLGYLFTIDTVHLYSRRTATAWLNNAPWRYMIEINTVFPPAAAVWNVYWNGYVEGSKTLRLSHVTGAGIPDVYSFRETIINDTQWTRHFRSMLYYLYNER